MSETIMLLLLILIFVVIIIIIIIIIISIVPLPTGFARKGSFWKMIIVTGITACLIGVICSAYMNFVDNMPQQWASCDFSNDITCGDFYSGDNKWWMGVTVANGFVIGVIRYLTNFPEKVIIIK